jgi:hypothetical protein
MSDKTLKQGITQIGEAAKILQNRIVAAKANPFLGFKLYVKILIKKAKNFVGTNQY